jgi:hypothetical protein
MRYKEIYKQRSATSNVPNFTVSDRESDIYVNYNYTDRLDLMSNRYYGSPKYWWIILKANSYHMEFDIEAGEVLRIPLPLVDVVNEIKDQI